jgi:hypothetical protein
MSCPECQDVVRDYLIFKNAVYRFARTLAQLDKERLRVIHVNTPKGMPNIARLAEMIDSEAGFRPQDSDVNEGSESHALDPDPSQIRQPTPEPVGQNPTRQSAAYPSWQLIAVTALVLILFSMIV